MRLRRTPVRSVTFITRAGCTMCEQAQPLVQAAVEARGLVLEVRDVDGSPDLSEWSDHVPVVLVDGKELSRWWVDEAALRKVLRSGV